MSLLSGVGTAFGTGSSAVNGATGKEGNDGTFTEMAKGALKGAAEISPVVTGGEMVKDIKEHKFFSAVIDAGKTGMNTVWLASLAIPGVDVLTGSALAARIGAKAAWGAGGGALQGCVSKVANNLFSSIPK